jgi:hypothetical protein
MTLLDNGWTEEQAKGLLDSLKVVGAIPNRKPEHLQGLYDWCSAHQKDHKTIDGQLEFIAICNSYEDIGMALKRAIEEARAAVEPYVRRLSASEMAAPSNIERLVPTLEQSWEESQHSSVSR